MFSILVSYNPTAWETDQIMRMDRDRFKEYSDGVEAKQISLSTPNTLRLLENSPALLMYESGSEARHLNKVRFGLLHNINIAGNMLTFCFAPEGTFQRNIIQEFGDRLGINSWEYNRTHWAIKDGAIPTVLMSKLRRPKIRKPIKATRALAHSKSPYGALALWNSHNVVGAKFDLEKGAAVTRKSAMGLPGYWFSSDGTVVVGRSIEGPGFESPSESVASWNIPIPSQKSAKFERTFLLIGCLRRFGGLHSREYDKRADIYVNGKQVDGFALRVRPEGHSDYFHRPPFPANLPMLAPFSDCQTVYAWPLADGFLVKKSKQQRVTVRIDREARWDVDYVGFVTQKANTAPKVFLSHSHADKRFVRSLAKKLTAKKIKVWIDEAEIRPGDSLIEKLSNAIDSVDILIAVLSRASIKSAWVKKEIEIATVREIKHKRLRVIPLLLNDVELPGFLEGKLYADFTNSRNQRVNFPKLVKAIRQRV
jgi:TIR domain